MSTPTLSPRLADRLQAQSRAYRASKLRRDHEIELMLAAGVPLAEAIQRATPITAIGD